MQPCEPLGSQVAALTIRKTGKLIHLDKEWKQELTMKTLLALGLTGGFLLVPQQWKALCLVLWVASKVSHGLAVAVLREVLRAGSKE